MSLQQKEGPRQLTSQQKKQMIKEQQQEEHDQQVMEASSQSQQNILDQQKKNEVQIQQNMTSISKGVNPFLVKTLPNIDLQNKISLSSFLAASKSSASYKNLFTTNPIVQKEKVEVIKVPIKQTISNLFLSKNPQNQSISNLFFPKNLQNKETNVVVALNATAEKKRQAQLQQGLYQLQKYIIDEERQQTKETQQKNKYRSLFYICPSYQQLLSYTLDQLSSIKQLKIWNNYGQIAFLEAISIKDVKLSSIIMAQNKIQVLSDELSIKKKRFVYRNYLNYSNLSFQQKKMLKKQIFLQMQRKKLKIMYHSEHNGDLIVY